jgi:asparagine synthase (glutamine-hydrolysing)
MCGIAGIISDSSYDSRRSLIQRMLTQITHRGPDSNGLFQHKTISFGHARLSIMDVQHGQQPMTSFNNNSIITYNGEIFNFKELRKKLESKGVQFKTNCDTEVLINLYEIYGEECLSQLNGQFAFAIYDKKKNSIFLARDPFGILPLFYYKNSNEFLFASEIKSLYSSKKIERRISTQGLFQSISFWGTLNNNSCFENIYQIPPGHFIRLNLDTYEIKERKYWDLDLATPDKTKSEAEWSAELKSSLSKAVKIRLQADVPVGCYLSGGLDSSAIAHEAYTQKKNGIKTYSVSFESKDHDESNYQKEFLNKHSMPNDGIRISNQDINDNFENVIWHAESSIFRSAPTPLFLLSNLVHNDGVKVVLTGEGADEILFGYDTYKELKIRLFWLRNHKSEWRPLLLKRLFPQYNQFRPEFFDMQKAFYQQSLNDPSGELFSHQVRINNNQGVFRFLHPDKKRLVDRGSIKNDLTKTLPANFNDRSHLEKCQYLELKTLLQGYLLASQGDRMALAHSVELRFPYLDPNVVALSQKIPVQHKIRGLREKNILKKAYTNHLPDSIVNRHKHAYQAPDILSFINSDINNSLSDKYLNPETLNSSGLWDPRQVNRLIQRYKEKKYQTVGNRENMAFIVILSTMILQDKFVTNFEANCHASDQLHFSTIINGL